MNIFILVISALVRLFVYRSLSEYFAVTLLSASMLAALCIYILLKKVELKVSYTAVLVLLWLAYIAAHTLILGGEHYKLYLYVGYVCLFLFVSFALQCKLLNRNTLIGIFYVFGLVEAVVCMLQANGAVTSANTFFGVTGTFENPNVTAMYLSACLPFGLFSLVKKRKFPGIASIVILLIAIVLLKCRTAFVGAFVVFCIYFWQKEKIKQLFKRYQIITVALLLLILFSGVFLYNFKKASADGRLFIWEISTSMITEKPIVGVGYGFFERDYNLAQAKYFQSGAGSATEKQNADHVNMAYNEYIEQAVEGGIFGLLFYLVFLAWALYVIVKQKDVEAFSVVLLTIVAGGINFVIQCIPLCILLFAYCALLKSKELKINRMPVILLTVLSLAFVANQSKLMYAQMQLKDAVTLAKRGEQVQALVLLRTNYRRAETSEAFIRYYGKILLQNKEFDAAEHVLERATQYSSLPDIYFSLATCYMVKGDYEKAEKSLQFVSNMIPKNKKLRERLSKRMK